MKFNVDKLHVSQILFVKNTPFTNKQPWFPGFKSIRIVIIFIVYVNDTDLGIVLAAENVSRCIKLGYRTQ